MHGLPKLVANISSQFHHLFKTGLAVESLEKIIDIDFAFFHFGGVCWGWGTMGHDPPISNVGTLPGLSVFLPRFASVNTPN